MIVLVPDYPQGKGGAMCGIELWLTTCIVYKGRDLDIVYKGQDLDNKYFFLMVMVAG
jgi:hypothetical protein